MEKIPLTNDIKPMEFNIRGSANIFFYVFVIVFAILLFYGAKISVDLKHYMAAICFSICAIFIIYLMTTKHKGIDIIKIKNEDKIILKFCKGDVPFNEFIVHKGDIHILRLVTSKIDEEGVNIKSVGWELTDKNEKRLYKSIVDPRSMYMKFQITELEDFCLRECKDYLTLKGTPAQLDMEI